MQIIFKFNPEGAKQNRPESEWVVYKEYPLSELCSGKELSYRGRDYHRDDAATAGFRNRLSPQVDGRGVLPAAAGRHAGRRLEQIFIYTPKYPRA
jgi:hypothetical protein